MLQKVTFLTSKPNSWIWSQLSKNYGARKHKSSKAHTQYRRGQGPAELHSGRGRSFNSLRNVRSLFPLARSTRTPFKKQGKMVIHTFFTSLVPAMPTGFAQKGILTNAITGQTPIRERARIATERQRDDSQYSDFTAWVVEDNKLSYVKPAPCRILIITSVGTAGINLYRANHMILFDHFLTHQEMVQTVGRMARKGQLRECIVDLITVYSTADDWMFGLSESKGLAASTLFGRVDRITIQTEYGESWELGQDNPLTFQADTVGGLKKAEE